MTFVSAGTAFGNSFDDTEESKWPVIATGLNMVAPVSGSQTYSASSLVKR